MARLLVTAAALLAFAASAGDAAGPVLVLDRTSAEPNDRVTVRTSAFTPGVRLYLVRRAAVPAVRSRTDRRLSFIGTLQRDRRGRGALTFSVPPLDAGIYELASWRRGTVVKVHRAAQLQLRSTSSCPVTLPNGNPPPGESGELWYGNGHLWAGVPADGTNRVSVDRVAPDGSIFDKLPWATSPPWEKPSISGERLDVATPPLDVIRVNGSSSTYRSAVSFPTAGCWRLTARFADVSLTYVVNVVVEP